MSNGMVGIVVYFTLTWAFAPLAYIRFPDVALPDFYPCFQVPCASEYSPLFLANQVLNSCMGVIIFVLLGLASTRCHINNTVFVFLFSSLTTSPTRPKMVGHFY